MNKFQIKKKRIYIFNNDIQEPANNTPVPAADNATQQWKQTSIWYFSWYDRDMLV